MAFLVPESFTRNTAGKIYKSKNDARNVVANELHDKIDNIKRPKKRMQKNVRNKDIAEAKNNYLCATFEKSILTKQWESSGKKTTFQKWNNKRTTKNKYAHLIGKPANK